mgnify:CR=1 FL=1
MKSRATGHGLVEFIVVAAALAAALFLPYLDGRPVVGLLVHSLIEHLRGTAFLTSIL